MRVVYLAHPLSGDIAANIQRAKRWYRWVIINFEVAVIADWLLTVEVLDDNTPSQRTLGMSLNEPLLERCDEIWLVGGKISAGMQAELGLSEEYRLAIKDLTFLGEEPPMLISREIRQLIAQPRSL